MNRRLPLFSCISSPVFLFLASIVFNGSISAAESGSFRVGSVAMTCTAPKDRDFTEAQFQRAFPRWVEILQKLANEGVVKRAHYLSELKTGIFIIIAGENPQDALNNAVLTSYQLSQIFIDATGFQNFNSCTYIQLGAVAILPSDQY